MEKDKEIFDRLKKSIPVPDIEEQVSKEAELPKDIDVIRENCITVEGKLIEIKPTLLKYFRNNSVGMFRLLETIPLSEIFRMTEEKSGIDGDAGVLTFISAVLDDAKLAKRIYDKMDAGELMKLIKIFKRLNGIEEREEKQKNVLATKPKA
jgi:hypothetical protein